MIVTINENSPVSAYLKLRKLDGYSHFEYGTGYGEFLSFELAKEFIDTVKDSKPNCIDYVSIAGTGEYVFFNKGGQ